jgi:hypothetical protein
MWRLYAGAILIVGGVATFIAAHRHIPVAEKRPEVGLVVPASGLSDTAYDLVRIGGWALVVLGSLLVLLGLIHYALQHAAIERPATAGMSAGGASSHNEVPPIPDAVSPGEIEAASPWDDGSHGEAVQPVTM